MNQFIRVPLVEATQRLSVLFNKAEGDVDPANYLYTQGARKILFDIESLLRLALALAFSKKTLKYFKIVKKLEDALGKIDEHDNFQKEFVRKKFPGEQVRYFQKKTAREIKNLNKKLSKHHFYKKELKFLSKTKTSPANKKDAKTIKNVIKKEVRSSLHFFNRYSQGFDDIEAQVHELRRRLRWLSIYAQSLQGLVKLKDSAEKYGWENKYYEKSWLTSPYNKLPLQKGLAEYIYFSKKPFMALNALIRQLGEIKDEGFLMRAHEKAIKKTGQKKQGNNAGKEGKGSDAEEKKLLKNAHSMLKDFFVKDRVQDLLVL